MQVRRHPNRLQTSPRVFSDLAMSEPAMLVNCHATSRRHMLREGEQVWLHAYCLQLSWLVSISLFCASHTTCACALYIPAVLCWMSQAQLPM